MTGWLASAKSFDMQAYLRNLDESLQIAHILQDFPYETYLEEIQLQDYPVLEQHRLAMNAFQEGLGEQFIRQVFAFYRDTQPVDLNDPAAWQARCRLGEMYLYLPKVLPDCSYAYPDAGDLLLEHLAHRLGAAIQSGERPAQDPDTYALQQRLVANRYLVNLPTSRWAKLAFNLKEGRFMYILDRVHKDYPLVLYLGLPLCLLVLVLFMRRKKKNSPQS